MKDKNRKDVSTRNERDYAYRHIQNRTSTRWHILTKEFLKLQKNYLFADIAKKVNAYKTAHPDKKVISLGIGDVTQPLAPAVIEAMHKAVDDMATKEHFHGYGPEQGYLWLVP